MTITLFVAAIPATIARLLGAPWWACWLAALGGCSAFLSGRACYLLVDLRRGWPESWRQDVPKAPPSKAPPDGPGFHRHTERPSGPRPIGSPTD